MLCLPMEIGKRRARAESFELVPQAIAVCFEHNKCKTYTYFRRLAYFLRFIACSKHCVRRMHKQGIPSDNQLVCAVPQAIAIAPKQLVAIACFLPVAQHSTTFFERTQIRCSTFLKI